MRNDWVLLLGAVLTAFSYSMMSSVTQAEAVVIAGKERSGIANSTYYIGIDLGMSLGPMLGGPVLRLAADHMVLSAVHHRDAGRLDHPPVPPHASSPAADDAEHAVEQLFESSRRMRYPWHDITGDQSISA